MHFQLYPNWQVYANICTLEALLRQPHKSGRWFTEPPYLLTPEEVDRLDDLMSHLDAHNGVWMQSNFNRRVLHWKLAPYQRFSYTPAAEHAEIKIMSYKCLLAGLGLSLSAHPGQRKHWLYAGQQLSIYNTSLAAQNTNVSHPPRLSISVCYSFCPCSSLCAWYSISFTLGALMKVWYSALHHWSPIHAQSPLQCSKRITQLADIGCHCVSVCVCVCAGTCVGECEVGRQIDMLSVKVKDRWLSLTHTSFLVDFLLEAILLIHASVLCERETETEREKQKKRDSQTLTVYWEWQKKRVLALNNST